ncbi:hypothetical protein ACFS2C_15785 [Prauserella oleivorans]|uniref:Transmembrane protein n=1 Tax=Prauserella oleivorans TaxID=1478153 RepID=A0ABW5WAA0_9PSEU
MPESATYLARLWRRIRVGRNPMARRADRVEGWLLAFALIAPLLALPVAVSAGSDGYARAVETVRQETHSRHQVTATLLADAEPSVGSSYGAVLERTARVRAEWPAPDGSVRTGMITTEPGYSTGSTVRIWLNESGGQTVEPRTAGWARWEGIAIAAMSWFAVVLPCAAGYGLARRVLDTRRLRAWDREWARIDREPSGS